jgi:putative membrane protein (TIGR04086 family)
MNRIKERVMYQRDWLDELRWIPILLGVVLAIATQIVLTWIVLRPFNIGLTWAAVVLVEVCIFAGAFVTGWRADRSGLINGLAVGLISAALSLLATVLQSPTALTAINIVFLFVTFGIMGALGGFAAQFVRERRLAR